MLSSQCFITLLAAVSSGFAAPANTSIAQDSADMTGPTACGPTQIISDNGYTVMADAYNANPSEGVHGKACVSTHGHNKQGIQWSSSWDFNADPNDDNPVKAYPNAYNPHAGECKKAKDINLINTFWKWSYNHKGKRLTADISYDMFLKSGSINPGSDCTPASEDHHYEVMIWLAAIGKRTLPGGKEVPFRPLGSKVKKGFTYKNKHGREFHFELYKGKNNPFNHPHEVTVYSFLPQNGQKYDEFEANLAPFLHDLAKNHEKAVGEATLQSIQAGTETVDAEHATFQTHEYSIGG